MIARLEPSAYPEGNYIALGFAIELNKLRGGTATATLQHGPSATGPFVNSTYSRATQTYSGSGGNTWDDGSGHLLYVEHQVPAITVEWVRLVVDYTCLGGETGQLVSDSVLAFLGSYATYRGAHYLSGTNNIRIEYDIDTSVVTDPGLLSSSPSPLYNKLPGQENWSVLDTYTLSSTELTGSKYYITYTTSGDRPTGNLKWMPCFRYNWNGSNWDVLWNSYN